jgi:hypothetical protein
VKTRITGALVLRLSMKEFEHLLVVLEEDFPEVQIIYKKTSAGKLWILEGEAPNE